MSERGKGALSVPQTISLSLCALSIIADQVGFTALALVLFIPAIALVSWTYWR